MNTVALWIGWAVMATAGIVATVAAACLVLHWTLNTAIAYLDVAKAFCDFCWKRGRERERGPSNAGVQAPERSGGSLQ